MFNFLKEINKKPEPFQFYTAEDLWTNEHTSKKMLEYHLNASIDAASRNINFINRSVNWISTHFGLNTDSKVIDFGCGPGLYTTRFAENGVNITGVDFSKRSLEYAKKTAENNNLEINYIHKNYFEFESNERFDLITMIMCDFCALSPVQRKDILCKFRDLLKPAGSILLDVYSLNYYNQIEEKALYELNQLNNFWSSDDYYGFLNTFKYDNEKLILDKYSIIEKTGTRIVYNWQQCFSEDSIRREFQDNGLTVKEMYSDVSGSEFSPKSLEMAVVAGKI